VKIETKSLGEISVTGRESAAKRGQERRRARRMDVRVCKYCSTEFLPRDRRGVKRFVCYNPRCERKREADRIHRAYLNRKRREARKLREERDGASIQGVIPEADDR